VPQGLCNCEGYNASRRRLDVTLRRPPTWFRSNSRQTLPWDSFRFARTLAKWQLLQLLCNSPTHSRTAMFTVILLSGRSSTTLWEGVI